LCFCSKVREIVTFGTYFDDFLETLPNKVVEKIDYIFLLLRTEERITQKFVKHITSGLYEIRIQVESNIYRVFFCFDEGRLVVLFNGFQKKTQKTPTKEINTALKIMKEYYGSKK
jgi:phage-related protein